MPLLQSMVLCVTHISLPFLPVPSLSQPQVNWMKTQKPPPAPATSTHKQRDHRWTKWIGEGREQAREGRQRGLAANPIHGQSWGSLTILPRWWRDGWVRVATPCCSALFKKPPSFVWCEPPLLHPETEGAGSRGGRRRGTRGLLTGCLTDSRVPRMDKPLKWETAHGSGVLTPPDPTSCSLCLPFRETLKIPSEVWIKSNTQAQTSKQRCEEWCFGFQRRLMSQVSEKADGKNLSKLLLAERREDDHHCLRTMWADVK